MSRTSGLLVALPVALLACASAAPPGPAPRTASPNPAAAQAGAKAPAAEAQRDAMLICEMERPTGSNIAERVCHPATEAEIERLRTQDMMRTLRNPQKVKSP